MGNTTTVNAASNNATAAHNNNAVPVVPARSSHSNIKIYAEILKDAAKLKQQDKKSGYNQHRREESIAKALPKQLQPYSNAIHIVNEFWLDHIEVLSEEEMSALAMVLYCHFFLNCEQKRSTILAAQKNHASSHALKMMHVLSYIIRNLIHPSNHLRLFRQLQSLGSIHRAHCITNETYEQMLEAFNYAMEEKYQSHYRVRTRFCFSHIFRVIVDIMTGDDFHSFTLKQLSPSDDGSNHGNSVSTAALFHRLSGKKNGNSTDNNHNVAFAEVGADTSSPSMHDDDFDDDELHQLQGTADTGGGPPPLQRQSTHRQVLYDQIDGFLGSLEECLSDEVGVMYFKKFCEEQFCVENFLFHEAVMRYRACQSHPQRVRIGEDIIAQFVEIGSAKEINLAYATRGQILTIVNLVKKMNENKHKYRQLLSSKRKDKNVSIMTKDDIDGFLSANSYGGGGNHLHNRLPTAKKLPLELAKVTKEADEDFESVICSMGFTPSLFDRAYQEIFALMRSNTWNRFRNTILQYCGDSDFVQHMNDKQKQKKNMKKMETRQNMEVLQMFTAINEKYIAHNSNNGKHTTQHLIRSALQKARPTPATHNNSTHALQQSSGVFVVKTTNFQSSSPNRSSVRSPPHHRRRTSRDDFELNTKANYHAHALSINTNLPKPSKPKLSSSAHGQMDRSPIHKPQLPPHQPHTPLYLQSIPSAATRPSTSTSVGVGMPSSLPVMCPELHLRAQSDASDPLSDAEDTSEPQPNGSIVIKSIDIELSLMMPSTSMCSASTVSSANNTPFDENELKFHCNADVALMEDEELSFNSTTTTTTRNKIVQPRLSFIPKLVPAVGQSVTSPTVHMHSTYSVRNMRTPDMTPGGGAAVELPTPLAAETGKPSGASGGPSIIVNNVGQYSPSELFNFAADDDDDNRKHGQQDDSPFDVALSSTKSNLRSSRTFKPDSSFFDADVSGATVPASSADTTGRASTRQPVAPLNGLAAYPRVQENYRQFKKRTSGMYSANWLQQQQNEALLLEARKSKSVSPPDDDEDGLPLYITHKRRKSKLKSHAHKKPYDLAK